MWPWLVLFSCALLYKLVRRDDILVTRAYDVVGTYSSLFMSVFCFMIALQYVRLNVESDKWKWHMYTSHAILAVVNTAAALYQRAEWKHAVTIVLIGSGLAYSNTFGLQLRPWCNLWALCGIIGCVRDNRNASTLAFAVAVGYVFYIFIPIHMPTLETCVWMILPVATKCITLIMTDCATQEVPWSMILAMYNIVQLSDIPFDADDTFAGEDFIMLTFVGCVLFLLQWTTLAWLSSLGAASYCIGIVLIDMLFVLAGDLSSEATYVGWICVFIYIVLYANYPSSQNQPHHEPSVPPLPPESPKMKREDSKPSAPPDLPDPPSEVPVQGEIV